MSFDPKTLPLESAREMLQEEKVLLLVLVLLHTWFSPAPGSCLLTAFPGLTPTVHGSQQDPRAGGCPQYFLSFMVIPYIVTKSGIRLLATQKPIKRQGWWKGKFALFWMPATSREGGLLSKGQLLLPRQSMGKSCYRWREGATCRDKHSQL